MIMHKGHREKVLSARLDALNEQNAIAKNAGAYAHPQDPNRGEMLRGAAAIANKDSEKYKVQTKGTPEYDEEPPEEKKSGGLFSKKK